MIRRYLSSGQRVGTVLKISEALLPKPRAPFAITGIECDAWLAMRDNPSVPRIGCSIHATEIVKSVVRSDAVDVVDQDGIYAVNQFPDQSMRKELLSHYAYRNIALAVGASCLNASVHHVPSARVLLLAKEAVAPKVGSVAWSEKQFAGLRIIAEVARNQGLRRAGSD